MRFYLLLLLLALNGGLWAQQEEIFQVVEEMPRFPGCEENGLTGTELKECSQQKMLEFVYQNITYPEEARQEGTEGTVVVRFVVTKDGSIEDAQIVREIGHGCGEEALRVVNLMNEKGQKWIPAKKGGQTVKVYFNLPVKYKLNDEAPAPEPLPYFLVGTDTVYTEYNEAPVYGTEEGALQTLLQTLSYPAGADSCVAGSLVMQLFINKSGGLKIGDIFDYSNLGFDYQFEAIKLINSTHLKWQAAKRNGRSVNCYVPIRIVFKPKQEACKTTAENYDKAYKLAADAEITYEEGKPEEAIAQWTEALAIMPGNTEFLLLRGQAYLEQNNKAAACADLQEARKVIPLADWVNQMLPLLCLVEEE